MLAYYNPRKKGYRQPRFPGPLKQALAVAGWTLLGWMVVVGLGTAIAFGMAPVLGWLSPFATVLLLASAAVLATGLRRTRDLAVLNYLEQAARLNLPLPAMLQAAEEAEGGRVRVRLAKLRRRLEGGEPVEHALASAAPGLPPRVTALVGAAEHSGRLAPVLGRLVERAHRAPDPNPARRIFYRWYPLTMVMGLGGVLTLVCIFVLPKYEQILKDFHLQLPPVTRFVFTSWVGGGGTYGAITVVVVLAVAALAICGRFLAVTFVPRWTRGVLFRALTDRLLWVAPGLGTAVRSRALADACGVIADGLEVGRTLEWSLSEAAGVPTNRVLEGRLARWRDGVLEGMAMPEAARRAGLPPLLTGMLTTAAAAGDVPEALRFLARYYEGRFSRAAMLLRAAVVPAAAIVFGVLVGLIALALFMPMVEMIDKLSRSQGAM